MSERELDQLEPLRDAYAEGGRWEFVDAVRIGLMKAAPEWVQRDFRKACDDHRNHLTGHFGENIFPKPRGRGQRPRAYELEQLTPPPGGSFVPGDRGALAYVMLLALRQASPEWVWTEFEKAFQDHRHQRTSHFGEKIFPLSRGVGQNESIDEDLVRVELGGRIIAGPRELVFLEIIESLRDSGRSIAEACRHEAVENLYVVEPEVRKQYYFRFRKLWPRPERRLARMKKRPARKSPISDS